MEHSLMAKQVKIIEINGEMHQILKIHMHTMVIREIHGRIIQILKIDHHSTTSQEDFQNMKINIKAELTKHKLLHVTLEGFYTM